MSHQEMYLKNDTHAACVDRVDEIRTAHNKYVESHQEDHKTIDLRLKNLSYSIDHYRKISESQVNEIKSWINSHSEDFPQERSTIYFSNFKVTSAKRFSRFSRWLWWKLLGVTIVNKEDELDEE